jgi:hypothetical protein
MPLALSGSSAILPDPLEGNLARDRIRGCSSAVERYLAKVNVEGSIPFTRFEDQPEGPVPSGCAFSRKWLVFSQKRAGAPFAVRVLGHEDNGGQIWTENDSERPRTTRFCAALCAQREK